jgi:hypothetical protein
MRIDSFYAVCADQFIAHLDRRHTVLRDIRNAALAATIRLKAEKKVFKVLDPVLRHED